MAAVTAASWPAYAHHSFAVYDRSKVLTLKGSVKSFQWTNPHCVIWVLVQPEGGGEPQEWSFETTSPGVLTRGGWTRNSVKPGDRVSRGILSAARRLARRRLECRHAGRYRPETVRRSFAASEKPELK